MDGVIVDPRGHRELRIDMDDLHHLHLMEGPDGLVICLQERLGSKSVTVRLSSDVIGDLAEFLVGSAARFAKEGRDGREDDQLGSSEG